MPPSKESESCDCSSAAETIASAAMTPDVPDATKRSAAAAAVVDDLIFPFMISKCAIYRTSAEWLEQVRAGLTGRSGQWFGLVVIVEVNALLLNSH